MSINTNINALNAHRSLNTVSETISKASEKLSSGLKLNRAADDAAGLAISERMKAQIRGLRQAQRNVEDGTSVTQIADGGMSEISSMIIRQRELIIQALNDTNTDDDRIKIQSELDRLNEGINSTANDTEFNTIKLLCVTPQADDGSVITNISNYLNTLGTPPVNTNGSLNLRVANADGTMSSILDYGQGSTSRNQLRLSDGTNIVTLDIIADMTISGPLAQTGDNEWSITYKYNQNGFDVEVTQIVGVTSLSTLTDSNGDPIANEFYDLRYEIKNNNPSSSITADFLLNIDTMFSTPAGDNPGFAIGGTAASITNGTVFPSAPSEFDMFDPNYALLNARVILSGSSIINAPDKAFVGNYYAVRNFNYTGGELIRDSGYSAVWSNRQIAGGGTLSLNSLYGVVDPRSTGYWNQTSGPTELYIQSGANALEGVYVSLYDCRAESLGLDSISALSVSMANNSLKLIDKALTTLNSYRATCGAEQNRLEHSNGALGVAFNNLEDANSRIADADMAKEMMKFTKYRVLYDAASSMLAQLNQAPQTVLQLLR